MQSKFTIILGLVTLLACSSPDIKKPSEPISQPKSQSKEEEISAWAQYEWELTHDPATGEVPRERLIESRKIMELRSKRTSHLRNLQDTWLPIGPANVGGRTRAVLVDGRDSTNNTVFAGSVSGGLYRSTTFLSDNPAWKLVSGLNENLAVSAIIQDPANPQVIYVGTGEGWFNSDASRGSGVWKSVDGGVSWNQLEATKDARYILDLELDSNGNIYASTRFAGVQKSTDGGSSWRQVLGIATGNADSDRGADLELGPDGTIYATMGPRSIGTVHRSVFSQHGNTTGDIETWEDITPDGDYDRIELAVAPSDSSRLYVICEHGTNSEVDKMWRSEDAGDTWIELPVPFLTATSDSTNFARKQAWYNLIASVDPNDEDVIIIGGIDLLRSEDGGDTWTNISNWFSSESRGFTGRRVVHADQHEILFLGGSSNEAIISNDGGIYHTNTLDSIEPLFDVKNTAYNTTQFYSCCLWPSNGSAFYMGGTQDNGTWLIRSEELNPDDITDFFGGDGGYCFLGNKNDQVIIVSKQWIDIAITLDGGDNYSFFEPDDERGAFINPFTFDEDAGILYGAFEDNQYFRVDDPVNQEEIDTVFVPEFDGAQISALTVDPNVENRLWVGVRRYFEDEWMGQAGVFIIDDAHTDSPVVTDVSDDSWDSALAPRNIEISNVDSNFMLLTFSNYGSPNVWITKDAGKSWKNIDGDLADMPVRWGVINPLNEEEIIIATELGVYNTLFIDGDNTQWVEYQNGMPKLRVNMLQIRPGDRKILAASYGQGLFLSEISSGEDNLIASFEQSELKLLEHVGPEVDQTECGEPIRSIPINIVLNRTVEDDTVTLSLSVKDDNPTLSDDLILPEPFVIPDSVTEFSSVIKIIDDGFREDAESTILELGIVEGEAIINLGEIEVSIKDDDSEFINLPVETELFEIGKSLALDQFTHFTSLNNLSGGPLPTSKAIARIRPSAAMRTADACAAVSIDRSGTELMIPSWLNGFSVLSKTFFVQTDLSGASYELELYFDPLELAGFDSIFLDLNLIRSDLRMDQVTSIDEIELIDDVIPQKLSDNLVRIKVTTESLGGFAVTNAPDLSTVSNRSKDLEGISIYPTLVDSRVFIRGPLSTQDRYYKVFDLQGRTLLKGEEYTEIEMSQLNPGHYIIEIGLKSKGFRRVYKVVKI